MSKKYRIAATRIEYFEIEVEADSKEEAMDFAKEKKHLFIVWPKFLRFEYAVEYLRGAYRRPY